MRYRSSMGAAGDQHTRYRSSMELKATNIPGKELAWGNQLQIFHVRVRIDTPATNMSGTGKAWSSRLQ
jgi:hypothetical protein